MKVTSKDLALVGIMVATLEVAKSALAFLPNIELVTLLIILYTLFFEKRIFLAIPVFVLLEGCLYGFGLWWIMYLYTWPALAVIVLLFKRRQSVWFWSLLSGFFGLSFGALCSIPYLCIGGIHTAFAWWVAGIPYDMIHGISNFILCLILFRPLRNTLEKAKTLRQ